MHIEAIKASIAMIEYIHLEIDSGFNSATKGANIVNILAGTLQIANEEATTVIGNK